MANSKALNNIFDQNDSAVGGRTNGDIFRVGAVDQPGFNPANGNFWWGSGNPNGLTSNVTFNASSEIETALGVIHRQGAAYTSVGSGPNGEQFYNVNAGTQIGNPARAEWNFNYTAETGAGHAPGDLAGSTGLSDHDFRMQITATGPGFGSPKAAVFVLDAATHVWSDESGNGVSFGGDDFQPSNAAPADVMAHVASNSVNLAFLTGDFGPLATSTLAGNEYDIKLVGHTNGNLDTFTHDHITLIAPPV